MKRFLALTLIAVTLSLSLISCDLSIFDMSGLGERDSNKETVVMYGVATNVGDIDHTCVFFANSGHMTLPRLASGEAIPEYAVGDLIKVTFKATEYGIPIMESFPGQFGAAAEDITVKSADVRIYYLEDELFYSDLISDGVEIAVGEEYTLFSTVEGKRKDVATGVVTERLDGSYTMSLLPFGDLEDFLMYRFEYGLSLDKK